MAQNPHIHGCVVGLWHKITDTPEEVSVRYFGAYSVQVTVL